MALLLIAGISGASGTIYGARLLQALRNAEIPSHLIISKSAMLTLKAETDLTANQVCELADATGDVGAATENGAIIMPTFYHRPKTIDDIVNQTVGRCLDLLDIDSGQVKRWQPEAGT